MEKHFTMLGLKIFTIGILMNKYSEHNHRLYITSNGISHVDKNEFEDLIKNNKIFSFTSRNKKYIHKEELLQEFSEYSIEYVTNSNGFRSDEFIKNSKYPHILFAGCSNTFGTGIEYEKLWSRLLYKKILKNVEGAYFNLGMPGASLFEIINNIYKYIREYGKPDFIFILIPDLERDARYFLHAESSVPVIDTEIYINFELFCKMLNIKLFSTSWITNAGKQRINIDKNKIKNNTVSISDNIYPEADKITFLFNTFDNLKYLEKFSENFKIMNESKLVDDVYYYCRKNPDDIFSLTAPDKEHHHGNAFHYAWSEYFYERYLNEKTNT